MDVTKQIRTTVLRVLIHAEKSPDAAMRAQAALRRLDMLDVAESILAEVAANPAAPPQ